MRLVNCRENNSSFQELCITNMIAEAIAGLSNGMIILEKIPILLHPSRPADSISSLGISAMKPVINHVTNGNDKQLSVKIGAR